MAGAREGNERIKEQLLLEKKKKKEEKPRPNGVG